VGIGHVLLFFWLEDKKNVKNETITITIDTIECFISLHLFCLSKNFGFSTSKQVLGILTIDIQRYPIQR